jgi:ribosomal protein S18 acetylase RimI-like enzyme
LRQIDERSLWRPAVEEVMPTTVRFAEEADIEALITLNTVVQSLHAALYPEDFKPIADPEGARAMFAARLAAPESGIAVAEVDEAPVGYVSFVIQPRPETALNPARPRLYVHLCVAKPAQRKGIATELLRFVERHASAEGISEIALDVWAANVGAVKFFESIGFRTFNIVLRKQVSPR